MRHMVAEGGHGGIVGSDVTSDWRNLERAIGKPACISTAFDSMCGSEH